jgi:hypothetical protein
MYNVKEDLVRKSLMAVGTSAVVLAVGVAGAEGQEPTLQEETLRLDSYEKGSTTAGPVSTRRKLAPAKWYLVRVKGTFSFGGPLTRAEYCGAPTRRPQRRSRRRPIRPAWLDVEFTYALPRVRGQKECAEIPLHWSNFEMTAGREFAHVEPVNGLPTRPTRSHRYRYLLQGTGAVARFRLKDQDPSDNSGVVTIRLRPARASEIPPPPPAPAPAPVPPLPAPPTAPPAG